eukprot:scaffold46886_cov28-Tisochrysis_lutea.AAC.6
MAGAADGCRRMTWAQQNDKPSDTRERPSAATHLWLPAHIIWRNGGAPHSKLPCPACGARHCGPGDDGDVDPCGSSPSVAVKAAPLVSGAAAAREPSGVVPKGAGCTACCGGASDGTAPPPSADADCNVAPVECDNPTDNPALDELLLHGVGKSGGGAAAANPIGAHTPAAGRGAAGKATSAPGMSDAGTTPVLVAALASPSMPAGAAAAAARTSLGSSSRGGATS